MVPTTRKCAVCMPQRSFQVALYQSGLFRIRDGFLLGVGGRPTLSSAQLLTVVVVVVLLSATSSNGMSSHCPVFSILLPSLVTSNGEEHSIGRNGKEVDKLNTLTSPAVGAEGGGGGGVRGGVKSGSLMVTCSFGTSWVTFIAPWRLIRKRTYT